MSDAIIDNLVSKETLDNIQRLIELIETGTASVEKFVSEGVKFNQTFGNSKTAKDFSNGVKDIDDNQKKLNDTQKKLADSQTTLAQETAKVTVQLQEQQKANKAAAVEALGLNDAYKKLEQAATAATKTAKNAGAEFGTNSEQFTKAAAEAKKLNDNLKTLDKSVGLNQRNVGNYSESFGVLETELTRVTAKINALNTAQREGAAGFTGGPRGAPDTGSRAASSDDLKQLTQQQVALQQVVSRTTQGFTSLTQELRTNERSLQTLRGAGLQDTEAFKTLQVQTDNSRRSFNEFAAQQKILSSQAPALTALTSAAKGLAGAYAVGAGAAALFDDEEGKINKEVQKLVAIMTVLQGLQEVHNLLMEKNAIATAVATAAQKAYAFVVGESTGALAAFKVALAATGIGLFIIALGYVITHFDELFKAADPVVDAINNLDHTTQQAKNALKAYGDTAEKITKGVLKDLHDQTKSLNDQLGLTATPAENATNQILALQAAIKKLNDQQKESGDIPDPFATGETTAETVSKLTDQVDGLNIALGDYLAKQIAIDTQAAASAFGKGALEAFKQAQDLNSRQLALQATGLDKRIALISQNYKLEQIIIETTYAQEQRAADGNRAALIEADTKYNNAKITAERNVNDEIAKVRKDYADRDYKAAADITERSVQQQIDADNRKADHAKLLPDIQILALRSALRDQLTLLQDQQTRELHVEGQTKEEKKNIDDKYNKLREKAEQDTSDKIRAIHIDEVTTEINLYEKLTTKLIAQLDKITDHTSKGLEINNSTFNKFFDSVQDGLKNLDKLALKDDPFGHLLSGLLKFNGNIADTKAVDAYIQSIKNLESNIKKLGDTGIDLAFSLQTDQLEKQKNLIQDQIDLINQKRDTDIAAINASSKSEQDKANAIAVVNATADAKQREAERKQRDLDRKKAIIEKQASITRILESTAEAVMAALGEKPYKQTNIANAAIIGAIGLAQIAKIVAQPIPSYDIGTTDHPGGAALVHPGELMVTPEGKLMETPSLPTVLNLPAHSMVYPDINDALAEYYGGMTVQKFNSLSNNNSGVEAGLRRVEKAIKGKQETHFHERSNGWEKIINSGGNIQRWIKQNIS